MAAAFGTLAVVSFYLIAQMVGAGNLIKMLFGISYEMSVVIVGMVMLAYVLFGGMIATTWVQIVKAVLLLGGAFLLAVMVLVRFAFNPLALFAAAAERYGAQVLAPGQLVSDPWTRCPRLASCSAPPARPTSSCVSTPSLTRAPPAPPELRHRVHRPST